RNHEEVAMFAAADGGFCPAIKGSWTIVGIVCAPVDMVDDPPLCWGGKGRHGEIGVAAEVAEQGYLTIEAAPLAIGARVIERPVAMNEAEDCAAVLLAKEAMIVRETVAK